MPHPDRDPDPPPCGGVSIFQPDMRLRLASPDELAEIPPGLLEEFAITRVLLEHEGTFTD